MNSLLAIKLPLNSKDVIVRELRSEDVPSLYEIDSDPDVKKYLDGPVRASRSEWISRLQERCPSTETLAVCDRVGNAFLGRASIERLLGYERSVEMQIVLGKAAWGRHLGRQVASALIEDAWRRNASEVIAKTHPMNKCSHALLMAMGFHQTGTVQSNDWTSGFAIFRLASGV